MEKSIKDLVRDDIHTKSVKLDSQNLNSDDVRVDRTDYESCFDPEKFTRHESLEFLNEEPKEKRMRTRSKSLELFYIENFANLKSNEVNGIEKGIKDESCSSETFEESRDENLFRSPEFEKENDKNDEGLWEITRKLNAYERIRSQNSLEELSCIEEEGSTEGESSEQMETQEDEDDRVKPMDNELKQEELRKDEITNGRVKKRNKEERLQVDNLRNNELNNERLEEKDYVENLFNQEGFEDEEIEEKSIEKLRENEHRHKRQRVNENKLKREKFGKEFKEQRLNKEQLKTELNKQRLKQQEPNVQVLDRTQSKHKELGKGRKEETHKEKSRVKKRDEEHMLGGERFVEKGLKKMGLRNGKVKEVRFNGTGFEKNGLKSDVSDVSEEEDDSDEVESEEETDEDLENGEEKSREVYGKDAEKKTISFNDSREYEEEYDESYEEDSEYSSDEEMSDSSIEHVQVEIKAFKYHQETEKHKYINLSQEK